MSKSAAQKAYAKAGIKPSDVQVVELHGKRFLWSYKFKKTKEYYSRENTLKAVFCKNRPVVEGLVLETFDLLIMWCEQYGVMYQQWSYQ